MLGVANSREHSLHRIENPRTAEPQIVTAIETVTRNTNNSSFVDCLELLNIIFSRQISFDENIKIKLI